MALSPVERRRRRPIEGGKSNERSKLKANSVGLLAQPPDFERQYCHYGWTVFRHILAHEVAVHIAGGRLAKTSSASANVMISFVVGYRAWAAIAGVQLLHVASAIHSAIRRAWDLRCGILRHRTCFISRRLHGCAEFCMSPHPDS